MRSSSLGMIITLAATINNQSIRAISNLLRNMKVTRKIPLRNLSGGKLPLSHFKGEKRLTIPLLNSIDEDISQVLLILSNKSIRTLFN